MSIESIEGPSEIREGEEDSQRELIENWYEVLESSSPVDTDEFLTRIGRGSQGEVEEVIQSVRNELDPDSEDDEGLNFKLEALARYLEIDIGSEFDPSEGAPEMESFEGEYNEE